MSIREDKSMGEYLITLKLSNIFKPFSSYIGEGKWLTQLTEVFAPDTLDKDTRDVLSTAQEAKHGERALRACHLIEKQEGIHRMTS